MHDDDIMVVWQSNPRVVWENATVVEVRCHVCRGDFHRVQIDGALECMHCRLTISALESLQRASILRVNLPKTWEVSWLPDLTKA